ncbi:MAG: tetratricopeptide repeat protein [Anaerolineales bacterium]|nr:tetratricopeptide repeat protein [Anaerolineales bacterium]
MELNQLIQAARSGGALISGLQGMGGVGKTALAYRVVQTLCDDYPDAQLLVELRGLAEQGQTPLTPAEAMAQVIHAWRPGEKLPETEGELRGLYQDALRGKRALLLLDNAMDAAQVAPLLPPAPCVVIITSRQHFALPGMQRTDLERLSEDEAQKLLRAIVPELPGAVADEIARLCAWLPLALRLAGSALAVRPDLTPAGYAARLAESQKRLELIEASASLSYDLLSPEMQARWRALAVFPASFEAGAVTALWQVELAATRDVLGEILGLSLLEWDAMRRRYRLHDLLRVFANARLSDEERETAGLRHAARYQAVASAADIRFEQGGEHIAAGLQLFDREWENIRAGQAWAHARTTRDERAELLTLAFPLKAPNLLDLRLHARERIEWLEAAAAVAQRLGDRGAEASAAGSLGLAYMQLGKASQAIIFYEQALLLSRELSDRQGEGASLSNLGLAQVRLGNYSRAIEYFQQTLLIAREIKDRRAEGHALGNIGGTFIKIGDARQALEFLQQRLSIAREIGDRRGEGNAVGNLGSLYLILGNTRAAVESFQQALTISGELGDRQGEKADLANLGVAYAKLGDSNQAISYYQQALVISQEIDDMQGLAETSLNLALLLARQGPSAEALPHAERAAAHFERIGHTEYAGRARDLLARLRAS